MTRRKKSDVFVPRFRSVEPAPLALTLAAAVDVTPTRARLAERVAWFPGTAPELMPFVDVDVWLAWSLTGLRLFGVESPSYRDAMDAAGSTLLVLNMARSGDSISETARVLGSARRVIRDRLRRRGLYPPVDTAATLLGEIEPTGGSIVRAYASAVLPALGYLLQRARLEDRDALRAAAAVVERLVRAKNGC